MFSWKGGIYIDSKAADAGIRYSSELAWCEQTANKEADIKLQASHMQPFR